MIVPPANSSVKAVRKPGPRQTYNCER
jgi:hypothetical protein